MTVFTWHALLRSRSVMTSASAPGNMPCMCATAACGREERQGWRFARISIRMVCRG